MYMPLRLLMSGTHHQPRRVGCRLPDCQLQEMEHRIARAGGHRSDDEARALNARIADLSKLLETVSAEHNMLTTQVTQQHHV